MESHTTAPQLTRLASASFKNGTPGAPPNPNESSPTKKTQNCSACSKADAFLMPTGICYECHQAEQEVKDAEARAASILADLDRVVADDLRRLGLSSREIRAEWTRVPKEIRTAIPREIMADLSAGMIPKRGFGLGSDTGTGKTMALAAIVRGHTRHRRQAFARDLPRKVKAKPGAHFELGPTIVWLTWPDTVNTLRAHAIDGEAEAILERAEASPLLVLDDLGRERIKGNYVDDWAASQLDRLVNHRYREELPTIWTTNLPEVALVGIYGMALVSRLTEDNPLVWMDGLPSMRIK